MKIKRFLLSFVIVSSMVACGTSRSPNGETHTGSTPAGNNLGASPVDSNNLPSGVSAAPGGDPNAQPVDDGVIASPNRTDWLTIKGNKFYTPDGKQWQGRGVTLHDTRSCDYCTSFKPNVPEVKRRIDTLVTTWHVNFIRLMLESWPQDFPDGSARAQYAQITQDSNYLHDIREIVEYIGTKPGVYVQVSLWKDPNFTVSVGSDPSNPNYYALTAQGGLPTQVNYNELTLLAQAFTNDAHVLFGVANEPEGYTDSLEPACQAAMAAGVQAIRKVEDAAGGHHHVVAVQGTEGWARLISYYVDHPVAGDNVAYETHPYTPQGNFETDIFTPANTLPVIIAEFAPAVDPSSTVTMSVCENTTGPTNAGCDMSLADTIALMTQADAAGIPWTAWDFHTYCNGSHGSNMLLDDQFGDTAPGCNYGIPLIPSQPWGSTVLQYITSKQ